MYSGYSGGFSGNNARTSNIYIYHIVPPCLIPRLAPRAHGSWLQIVSLLPLTRRRWSPRGRGAALTLYGRGGTSYFRQTKKNVTHSGKFHLLQQFLAVEQVAQQHMCGFG